MPTENILVAAHEPAREWLETALKEHRFVIHSTTDGWRALDLLDRHRPDLVICDLTLGDMDGLDLLEAVRDIDPDIPVIMMTAGEDLRTIIEAMERGAYECIERPVEICRLYQSISRALNIDDLLVDGGTSRSRIPGRFDVSRVIVGRSAPMLDIQKKIRQFASSRSNALIQGEEGTGKRLISRAIHDSGVTRRHPFVGVDLPALPDTVIEKVLFGEVAEKNRGQGKDRKGLLELAGTGTIFLSEISGLSSVVQGNLLKVLKSKEFIPVGGRKPLPLKARVIGASSRNLGDLVRAGKFREDLFYRIATYSITIPPLRERREDIPRLVVHLLRKINRELRKNVKRIPGDAIEYLQNEHWTGNVGELESMLTQAIAAADGDVLQKELLADRFSENQGEPLLSGKGGFNPVERDHIKSVLEETDWDKREAARLLKISRQTLYNKIKAYGISPT